VSEQEQQRKIKHRMAVLRHAEEFGNVALTCRYFGISRPTFYKWHERFETHGPDALRDRSSAPHHSPRATRADVVGKIIHQTSGHKIAMCLAATPR
jgi:transposase-like protein